MTSDPRDRRGFTVNRRRALAIGSAAAATLLSTGGLPNLGAFGRGKQTNDDPDSIERVHSRGITGKTVRVAVLDPTGFDPSHAALDGMIEHISQFGPERGVVDGMTHGTAAAAAVVRLAPAVQLSLASFRSTAEFVDALDWARSRAVDVILTPVAAYGSSTNRRSPVFRAAKRAVEAGCTVIAPTGNAALGHWQGPYGALAGEDSGTRKRLQIDASVGSASPEGRFVAWLAAEQSIDVDLTLALLRAVDGGNRWNLVSLSRPHETHAAERLVADLPDGEYALVVRPSNNDTAEALQSAEAERELLGRVEITTPTHLLASPRPAGSIAVPASVPGVLAVGATEVETRGDTSSAGVDTDSNTVGHESTSTGISPHSGRGPTASGAVGVDVVAPPVPWIAGGSPGTSAAAARAAGTVALVLDAAPHLDPADIIGILRASAGDVGRNGRDLAAGSGRLDVVAAVQRARSR